MRAESQAVRTFDVVGIGARHNGLLAFEYLARRGHGSSSWRRDPSWEAPASRKNRGLRAGSTRSRRAAVTFDPAILEDLRATP